MIRKILSILATVLVVLSCGALVGFSWEEESNAQYAGLEVDVEEIDGMFFVDAAAVKEVILARDSVSGTFVADLPLGEVTRWIREIPAVADVQVYPGLNRTLHVNVSQRKPLARLHHPTDQPDSYIDSNGALLPLSRHYTARVPVIHAKNRADAEEAFALVQATCNHAVWSAFIDQIEVRSDGGLDVIPRIGGARIHFGTTDQLDEKLNKLLVFYREQIARGNLNAYKRIDLEFQDQVVAERYY